MAETTMPSGGGGGGEQHGCRRRASGERLERVEGPRAVAAGERGPSGQILHKKIKGVKINRTRVVGGKPSNKKKTMSDMRGYKNVVEIERSTGRIEAPTEVTDRVELFPTTIEEG
jgi:hypothetical protein